MNVEFQALLKNKTWHLVPPHFDLNIIDCRWVFKLKHKPDGSIDHHKARLVAKGFKQQYGWIMMTPSVLLLNLPQSVCYCLLLFLVVGLFDKLIFRMLFFMAFLMRMYI
jgi:hypothetical protein